MKMIMLRALLKFEEYEYSETVSKMLQVVKQLHELNDNEEVPYITIVELQSLAYDRKEPVIYSSPELDYEFQSTLRKLKIKN